MEKNVLDLNAFGVSELSSVEMREKEGGIWLFLAAVAVIGVVAWGASGGSGGGSGAGGSDGVPPQIIINGTQVN